MGGKRVAGLVMGIALCFSLLPAPSVPAETLAGDRVALVEPSGKWHIPVPGSVDYTFTFGSPGDIPLLGDWDGDGIDTPGTYRPAQGSARLTNAIPPLGSTNHPAEIVFYFGMPGDRVFTGDWDGDGIDTLGLSRMGQVFLTNTNATSVAESVFWFGTHSDVPLAGDPDGNGFDGLFLHRPSRAAVFYTNDAPDTFVATTTGSLYFGAITDQLVIGDWDGDDIDTPGVFRDADTTVYLRNQLWTGAAHEALPFGRAGWQPLAGNLHRHVGSTPQIAPLTGLAGGDPSNRVVVVKYSNSWKARPQAGISEADMVLEVIVEGGVGRWIAIYQTQLPAFAGPIRSVREVDPKLIDPFDARVLHSGGQPHVRAAIAEVGVDEGNGRIPGYYREPTRRPVYDLMYDFSRFPEDDWAGTVAPVVDFDRWVPYGGQAATSIDITMTAPNTLAWEYEAGRYVRWQLGNASVDTDGAVITADSVVVMLVDQISTGRFDSAGQPVPDYAVTGTGEAVVFRNGLAWEATWERGSTDDGFRFFRPNGQELPMDPGRTWIHVTPTTGSVDWS
ncbi:MAG: DUF3048 domain-containing protein [Acidimicrobiia bacterium]|nr:DUF3048 domain-containing protein [Acidimicrobiia bacterium]